MKTSKLSADNFLDGSTPEPAIRSGDTGQRMPCFNSCQLMTILMCNQLSPGLPTQLESVRVNIDMPVVRTDGRSVGRSVGHVITKFSGMGRFIYPWCSAGALRARSSAKNSRLRLEFYVIWCLHVSVTPKKLLNKNGLLQGTKKSYSLLNFCLR